ncbi:MAG: DUF3352 domain-containing protein [Planctomycetota bacterium]
MVQACSLALLMLLGTFPLTAPHPQETEASPAPLSLTELVPGTTRFYVSIPSLSKSWEGFRSLPLYQAYRDEEVQAFLKSLGKDLEEPIPGLRWEFVEELLDLPTIFDGEAAFALVSADDDDWVLSLTSTLGESRVTAFVEKLVRVLRGFFPGGPESSEIAGAKVTTLMGPVSNCYVATREGQLVITTHRERLVSVLERAESGAACMAQDELFAKSRAGMIDDATSFFLYVPLKRLLDDNLADGSEKDRAALKASGLDTVQTLIASLSMHEGRASDRVRLDVAGKRQGFLDLFVEGPIDPAMARIAPQDTVLLGAGLLQVQRLYQTILNVAHATGTDLLENLQRSGGELAQEMGLRALSDVVGCLGMEVVVFAALPAGGFIPKFALAVEVLEPDKLQSNLLDLCRTLTGSEPKTTPYRGRNIFYLPAGERSLLEISICWCVSNGYLLASHHPTILKEVIGRLDGGKNTLADDEAFRTAWAKLPAKAGIVGYANTKRLFEYFYGALLAFAPFAGMELPFDTAMLPTPQSITTYLSFGLSGFAGDDRGLLVITESDGYGFTSIAMYALIVAAIWSPLDNWAHPTDRWPCCGSSLRGIHEQLETERRENQRYPATLRELYREDEPWLAGTCPKAMEETTEPMEEQEPFAHFEYVLSAKDLQPPESFPDDWMIAWDTQPRHNGGRIALLGNGEVVWLQEAAFQKRFEEQGR